MKTLNAQTISRRDASYQNSLNIKKKVWSSLSYFCVWNSWFRLLNRCSLAAQHVEHIYYQRIFKELFSFESLILFVLCCSCLRFSDFNLRLCWLLQTRCISVHASAACQRTRERHTILDHVTTSTACVTFPSPAKALWIVEMQSSRVILAPTLASILPLQRKYILIMRIYSQVLPIAGLFSEGLRVFSLMLLSIASLDESKRYVN